MAQHKSERKNNRKTAVIVALLIALVALLCFGGYTFSKYVTSGKGSGTASVAKWGYTANVDTTKLFGEEYKYDAAKTASIVNGTGANLTVKADTAGRNLVAPGTTGSMTFKIKGQAEVKALIAMGITPEHDIVLKVQKTGGEEIVYNPVKWTLKKNGVVVTGAENTTLHAVAATFHSDPVVGLKNAGDVLAETTYELVWAWAFEGTETFTGITVNELDTILGRRANDAGYTAYGDWTINEVCTEIKFELAMQVSQFER